MFLNNSTNLLASLWIQDNIRYIIYGVIYCVQNLIKKIKKVSKLMFQLMSKMLWNTEVIFIWTFVLYISVFAKILAEIYISFPTS